MKKERVVYANVMRFCKECNTAYLCDPRSNKLFCSPACEKTNSHRRNDALRRARKTSRIVDRDITLDEVLKNDNGVCYLCGEKVNWNDYRVINGKKYAKGKYPTIDHVVPLSKGGAHAWGNVRLACFSCNASKGARECG